MAVFSPSVNTKVEVRINSTFNGGIATIQGGTGVASRPAWANIIQIGSSALMGIAAPSLTRVTVSYIVPAVVGNASTVYVDATAAAVTVTLPLASSATNMIVSVKKVDSSINAVTVVRSGTDTIDGNTSYSLASQYDSNDFKSDSSNNFWGVH